MTAPALSLVPAPWDGAPRPPRAWQAEALPLVLDALRRGKRGVVSATMGSGKSVALSELCWLALHRLHPEVGQRIVVSTPRQFLVRQLARTIAERCGDGAVGRYYAEEKTASRAVVVTCNASLPALAEDFLIRKLRCVTWIADECHGTTAPVVKTAVESLHPACRLGFTATAYRSNRRESVDLFDEVLYRYTIEDARRDGVIVPFRVAWWDGAGRADDDLPGICLDLIRQHAGDPGHVFGPGLVNARDIADAESLAGYLAEAGYRAAAIHSRLRQAEQDARIEALHSGALDLLVHVNMLSEGVDYPWLRWLCMRRKVAARVRYAQELGRVLRTSPGKDHALVLDPHDLCRKFDLLTPEDVGRALEVVDESDEEPAEGAERGVGDERAIPVAALQRRLRRLLGQLRAAVPQRPLDARWEDGAWRDGAMSAKQSAVLGKMRWAMKYAPEAEKPLIKSALDAAANPGRGLAAQQFSAGVASDLISVLFALADGVRPEMPQPGADQRDWWQFWRWHRRWVDGWYTPGVTP